MGKITLRLHERSNILVQNLRKLHSEKASKDFRLVCRGTNLAMHKFLFKILADDPKKKLGLESELKLQNVSPPSVRGFLKILYTGETTIDEASMTDILSCAEQMGMKWVVGDLCPLVYQPDTLSLSAQEVPVQESQGSRAERECPTSSKSARIDGHSKANPFTCVWLKDGEAKGSSTDVGHDFKPDWVSRSCVPNIHLSSSTQKTIADVGGVCLERSCDLSAAKQFDCIFCGKFQNSMNELVNHTRANHLL